MKLKSLDIGRLTAHNNLILAPMAGYTDYAFRSLCSKLGAGLCVTEMVSAKGLAYNNENTKTLLKIGSEEKLTSAQLFGREPYYLRSACESEHLKGFEIIDINMGCPVPKIYNNGEGSKLMEEPDLAQEIVKECVKSGKIITVKFRAGIYDDNLLAYDFAMRMQDAGASLVTVHGRTRQGMYSGKVHYEEIARIKNALNIPVIANGGVFSVEDAIFLMQETGADGVAIGRGALSDPLLFAKLTNGACDSSLKDCVNYLIDERCKYEKDQNVAHDLRKFAVQFLKGVRGGKEAKLKIFQAESTKCIKEIINEVL